MLTRGGPAALLSVAECCLIAQLIHAANSYWRAALAADFFFGEKTTVTVLYDILAENNVTSRHVVTVIQFAT